MVVQDLILKLPLDILVRLNTRYGVPPELPDEPEDPGSGEGGTGGGVGSGGA